MGSTKKLRVLFTGGGTGGHIYPAIAVIQKMKNDPDIEKIYYIGCINNMEKEIVENEEIEFLPISFSGMPRKFGFKSFRWFMKLIKASRLCITYLYEIKPDVVIGTGGYVSAPVIVATKYHKIPLILHDSDAYPGMVNRFAAHKADMITVAFEEAKKYLKSKNIIVNGNPIRTSYNNIEKAHALKLLNLKPNKKTVLVMGGSQGAKTINDAVLNMISSMVKDNQIQVIHQTGKNNHEEYIKKLSEIWPGYAKHKGYIIKPYFEDMLLPLAAADIAVSRAGSLSISELNINGLPSILVPYPFSAADHQRHNALAMAKAGAAIWLEDEDCNSKNLKIIISMLLNDNKKLMEMQKINREMAKPDATDNLVNIIKTVANK